MRLAKGLLLALILASAALFVFACGDEGATGEVCDPGTFRCDPADPNVKQICSREGTWEFSKDCSTEGKICLNGGCVLPGTDGDTDTDGTTTGVCTPGETRCGDPVVVEICDQNGQWKPLQNCSSFGTVCQNGKCLVCQVGTTRCNPENPDIMQRCVSTGDDAQWIDVMDCSTLGDGITCIGGICQGTGDGDEDTAIDYVDPEGPPCQEDPDCGDPDMYCFKEEGQDEGICLYFCDIEGVDHTCPFGYICSPRTFRCERIEGFCTSSGQCMPGREFCDKEPGAPYGVCKPFCYLPGEACPEGTKCCTEGSSQTDPECVGKEGKCIPTQQCRTCYQDMDCGDQFYCQKRAGLTTGCCVPKCFSNDDCPQGLICDQGRCKAGQEQCDCGGGCTPGYICDPVYCQCVLNCPACGPMECCDATSAPNCYTCECVNPTVCGFLLEQCCFGYHCSAFIYGVVGYCI